MTKASVFWVLIRRNPFYAEKKWNGLQESKVAFAIMSSAKPHPL